MAGGAGEMIFLGDAPPVFMTSDFLGANAIAGSSAARPPASRRSLNIVIRKASQSSKPTRRSYSLWRTR
jgi:hypothetical protein